MRNRNGKKGFTLIELLIVIAIIGILAAVLIPNLMRARVTAAQRAAQAHSSNVYTAYVAALSEDMTATASDIGPANCESAGAVTVKGDDSEYSINDAPGSTTCAVVAVGTSDFDVTTVYGAGTVDEKTFVNGQEEAAGGS